MAATLATTKSQDEVKCASINTGSNVMSMCTVPVKIKGSSGEKVIHTYALLDSCSQGTFILDQLREHLCIPGRETSVSIKTINVEFKSPSKAIDGLQVSGINDDKDLWVPLPTTLARKELPVDNDDITKTGQLKQWKYLEPVVSQLNFGENISVGLLIGANCTKALEPIQVLQGRNRGPHAFRTRSGWCVVGPVSGTKNSSVSYNNIAVRQADTNKVGKHFFRSKKEVKENDITEMLQKMYNHEFAESQHKLSRENDGMSQEDLKFMQVLDNVTRLIDGHYEISLPLRGDNVRFPNNRLLAVKRFIYLQRKISRNFQFKNDYMNFMTELMSKGYATESTVAAENGKCWYLPHHGVYNPNKPGKIRVVFDLSAEFQGTSINKSLLPGPDLTNQIVGVLLRSREELVAVTGDIEAMYHQVKIPVEQRSFLGFFWWKNSDPQNEVVDHEMTAHVFGGISSPSCSNCALKKTAVDNVCKYEMKPQQLLREIFMQKTCSRAFQMSRQLVTW